MDSECIPIDFEQKYDPANSTVDLLLNCSRAFAEKYISLRTSGGFENDEDFLAVLLLSEERRQSKNNENFEAIKNSETMCYILTKKPLGQFNLGLLVNVDSKNTPSPKKTKRSARDIGDVRTFKPLTRNTLQTQIPNKIPLKPLKRSFESVNNEYEEFSYGDEIAGDCPSLLPSSDKVKMPYHGKFELELCDVAEDFRQQQIMKGRHRPGGVIKVMNRKSTINSVEVTDFKSKSGKARKCLLCIYCGKSVIKTNYGQHVYLHDQKRERHNNYRCVTCDEPFNSRDARIDHEVQKHDAVIIEAKRWFHRCPNELKCDKRHSSVNEANRHAAALAKELGVNFFKQDKFDTYVKNYSATLLPHMKPLSNFAKVFGCPCCHTVLNAMEDIDEHMKECHINLVWDKCKLCKGEDQMNPEHLIGHAPRVWVCNGCNWAFGCDEQVNQVPTHFCKTETRPSFGDGYLTFLSDYQLHYKCVKCDADFNTFDGVNRTGIYPHLTTSVHDTQQVIVDANGVYATCSEDNRHCRQPKKRLPCTRRDMLALKQEMPCEACGKKFNTLRKFKQHKKQCCVMFTCGICAMKVRGYGNYYYHKKKKHGIGKATRKLQCTVCGFLCAVKRQLSDHMNMHSGQRPYQCEFCSARFKHVSNWRSHLKLHKPERKHTCEYCGKGFTRLGVYKSHKATHTGESRFSCEYCEKKFTRKNKLADHIKKDHTHSQVHLQQIQVHPLQVQIQVPASIISHAPIPTTIQVQSAHPHPTIAVAAQNYVTLQQRYLGQYHNLS